MTLTGLNAHAGRYSNALGNKFAKNRGGSTPAVGDNMMGQVPDFLNVSSDSVDELPFS